mgnify:CR=1 FL=1
MCGIIGYTGPLEARKLLLDGLAGLEYRGYDSAGIAYFDQDSQIRLVKTVGKVAALREAAGKNSPTAASATPGGPPMEASPMPTPIRTVSVPSP